MLTLLFAGALLAALLIGPAGSTTCGADLPGPPLGVLPPPILVSPEGFPLQTVAGPPGTVILYPQPVMLPPMPPPGPASAHAMLMPPPGLGTTGFYRPSAYEHWNYRAINSFGQIRPKVNYYEGKAWYAFDGSPYPAPHSVPGVFRDPMPPW